MSSIAKWIPETLPATVEERLHDLELVQRATFNILQDISDERERLERVQRSVLNILEDFAIERAKLEETQRATFNILEDFVAEREKLYGLQRAAFNILEDLNTEKDKLSKLEQKFRGLLESAPDGIVVVDSKANIAIINSKTLEMFGYSREELIGKPVELLVPLRVREQHVDYRNQYLSDPVSRPMGPGRALTARRKDGSEFPVEISLSPLQSEQGTLITSIIRDITDRRRAEVALETANRELESFSYSVSHDLRAPLRGIDGFSQALLEEYNDKLDDRGREYLRYVRSSTQQMSQLIDDLLNLSRITRSEMHLEVTDLSELAEAVADELRRTQPERQAEFKIAPGLRVNADPRLLRIALTNLIGNAWKFTSKRPQAKIEVGITEKQGKSTYFVRDNGAGFDMTYASKLFGAFQRLHTPAEFPGTGIGLATVRRIIRRHGGEIWAESAVQKGATFYFTLGSST